MDWASSTSPDKQTPQPDENDLSGSQQHLHGPFNNCEAIPDVAVNSRVQAVNTFVNLLDKLDKGSSAPKRVKASKVKIQVAVTVQLSRIQSMRPATDKEMRRNIYVLARDAKSCRQLRRAIRSKVMHFLSRDYGLQASLTNTGWMRLYNVDETVAMPDVVSAKAEVELRASAKPMSKRRQAREQQRQEIDSLMASLDAMDLAEKDLLGASDLTIGKRKRYEDEEISAEKQDAHSLSLPEDDVINSKDEVAAKKSKTQAESNSEEVENLGMRVLEPGFIPFEGGRYGTYEKWHRDNTDGRSATVRMDMLLMAKLRDRRTEASQ